MYQDLIDKKAKLAVIGLGYVGLPIALEFANRGLIPAMNWKKKLLKVVILLSLIQ